MEEIKIKGLDEVIYYDKCSNGMPVYMWVNDKVNNFYMTLNVKYGSVDTEFKREEDKTYKKVHDGIAHFLEHVNFNIDENLTAHELFEKLGASINAFTTFDFTSYEVFASSEFEKNLNNLLDYVQKPYFTDKLVEKEKGIIVEEVKMGKNRPGHKLYYGMNRALFKKDKRRFLVTGEEDDVRAISAKELQLVYDTFYHPRNMFMVITGNFNPYEAIGMIKENQRQKKFLKYTNPVKKKIIEPVEVNKKKVEIEANVEIPKVKICYKMARQNFKDYDSLVLAVYLGAILRNNFGNTSLLKEDLMEKELITAIGFSKVIDENIVLIEITFETKYPAEVIPIIQDKIKNMEISEEDLKRRRRANVASLINDYDDIEYVNSDICDQLILYDKIYDNVYEIYNEICLAEAQKVIDNLNFDNYSIVSLVPFNKKG